MQQERTVKVSKYLSKHLRHQPERIGLTPDEGGWVEIDALVAAAAAHGFPFTRQELDHVVATNDKRRFAVEGTRIRASQGHSIAVDLRLPVATPPPYLYHGTVARHLEAIRAEGLRPMNRHDVHLSPDRETATRVGARRGRPVVLPVDAATMHRDGHVFHVSANGVWLTQHVPSRYLRFPAPH
ncbi:MULTISPECIES: RNA 2'-phosphotransferase [Streptomyces]|uniref:Probable RNA 2'-phosphotransferase n=2 Tax=Streptomyces TaxID=1883 RepID=KPTA_STRCO|nr:MULTISPECIES: RNA 2'-phosphotransferase [Streptomyces]Q9ZBX9.1 RecName: Full=Probable RNA 2'-phosphotransferase [Streptomyces coelicolor A3(2)]MDX2925258.1 RNA 2'-phosphotransferase [Streptomyces sp. NRRL_B-16638]MDX3407199.1 RNA 2'-phosphotransferase [Streptomyces sp. ME02-6977A]MYU43477.1 RNA 2'-phosphotransferase [Streptomyces sp. SID7813]NSL78706.1 RNA 2'-phosphotransferase [Streptomyces coelicolor]QFI43949.1 RNA 2'-phosphotransferase [Streptomyces coelicolor A3(2)]